MDTQGQICRLVLPPLVSPIIEIRHKLIAIKPQCVELRFDVALQQLLTYLKSLLEHPFHVTQYFLSIGLGDEQLRQVCFDGIHREFCHGLIQP